MSEVKRAALGEGREIGRRAEVSFLAREGVGRYDPKGVKPRRGADTPEKAGSVRPEPGNGSGIEILPARKAKTGEEGSFRPNGPGESRTRRPKEQAGSDDPAAAQVAVGERKAVSRCQLLSGRLAGVLRSTDRRLPKSSCRE